MQTAPQPSGFLTGDKAVAAIVLWASGRFDTLSIAEVLDTRENAVCRTLRLARDAVLAEASGGGAR